MPKIDKMQEALFEAAKSAMANAHAPYSNFPIGAAVLGANGKIYAGCNVENASFPEGTCAEASAIAAMVTGGEKTIREVCVVSNDPGLITPCGGCRQKIRELAGPSTAVFVCGPNGLKKRFWLDELLPESFGPEQMETKNVS